MRTASPGIFLLVSTALIAAASQTESSRWVSFSGQVRPFLETNCSPCHFGGQRAGGLSLASVSQILRGGGKGAAIVPGRADESRLILLMEHKAEPKMPPIPGAKPLDTSLIRAWIDQGAKDDSAAGPPPTANARRTPEVRTPPS